METTGLAVLAFLGLLLGFWLMFSGSRIRQRRGLGAGRTVSLDKVTLTSRRLGLTGRPDRLIQAGGTVIVEEWKSSRSLKPWHRAQMGVYFLLVEERFKLRPSHGFVVTSDDARHRIDDTAELRAWVLDLASRIRAARLASNQPIPVSPKPGKCSLCGQRTNCPQFRL